MPAVATSQPRLRSNLELFEGPSEGVYLLRTDGSGDLLVEDPSPGQRAALRWLAGREDEQPDPDESAAAIATLSELGLIEHPRLGESMLSPEAQERYDRQLAYFAELTGSRDDAERMQLSLATSKVVVIGVGGLGSWALASLACAGVGHLVAVDDDTVELSNLNRQFLYRRGDVGRPKVVAAREYVEAFAPELRFDAVMSRIGCVEDVARVIAGADFVVETADWPVHEIGRWVNAACIKAGIPHISAGQFPPLVRVGPTYIPGSTGCLECQERQLRRGFPLYDELVASRQRHPTAAATLGAPSALIGSMIGMEAIHYLTGTATPASSGRALIVDLRTFAVRHEPVEADRECPLCARAPNAAS